MAKVTITISLVNMTKWEYHWKKKCGTIIVLFRLFCLIIVFYLFVNCPALHKYHTEISVWSFVLLTQSQSTIYCLWSHFRYLVISLKIFFNWSLPCQGCKENNNSVSYRGDNWRGHHHGNYKHLIKYNLKIKFEIYFIDPRGKSLYIQQQVCRLLKNIHIVQNKQRAKTEHILQTRKHGFKDKKKFLCKLQLRIRTFLSPLVSAEKQTKLFYLGIWG